MYKYYNANPRGLYIEDCVLRAISVAEGISWEECHKKLSYLAGKEATLLSDVIFVEGYLDNRYQRYCYTGLTVGEFAKKCPKGNYLVVMNGHITAIINNVIVDTWDCSKRVMKCCWKVK